MFISSHCMYRFWPIHSNTTNTTSKRGLQQTLSQGFGHQPGWVKFPSSGVDLMYLKVRVQGKRVMYIWLVLYLPLWKIWVRQLGLLFPIDGTINMFQTRWCTLMYPFFMGTMDSIWFNNIIISFQWIKMNQSSFPDFQLLPSPLWAARIASFKHGNGSPVGPWSTRGTRLD